MTIPQGLQNLRNLKGDHIEVGKAMAGNLYPLDFLAFAVLNRSLCLSFGFASLIEQRNLIAAAPLLRFQKVSEVDEYVPDSIYAEGIAAMTEATRLTIQLVYYWAHQKTNPPETRQ